MQATPTAARFMTKNPLVFLHSADAHEAALALRNRRIQSAPVINKQGEVVGLYTQHQGVKALVESLLDGRPAGRVGDHLDEAHFIEVDTPILAVAEMFATRGHANGCLVVLEGRQLVGVVSRSDAIRGMDEHLSSETASTSKTLYLSALHSSEDALGF